MSDCPQLSDFVCFELSAKLGSNLKYLSLAKCEQITDAGLKQIAKHCNKLRYLNLRGCEAVSDKGNQLNHLKLTCFPMNKFTFKISHLIIRCYGVSKKLWTATKSLRHWKV